MAGSQWQELRPWGAMRISAAGKDVNTESEESTRCGSRYQVAHVEDVEDIVSATASCKEYRSVKRL
jgi:hypothetical protein